MSSNNEQPDAADRGTGSPELEFQVPPWRQREDGAERRVGFELEFSGIDLASASLALESALEGSRSKVTAAKHVVEVPGCGSFSIEVDWNFLQNKAREAGESGDARSGTDWIDAASRVAALLVPLEIVCPPIPLSQLGRLHALTDALREAGAKGTEESVLAAYGVHINAELPAVDAATLQRYLRAYALLQWWLVDTHAVDATRRITSYIDPYPEPYLRAVIGSPEADMGQIFDDYLEHNPTRNRALDLLPILAHIDAERLARHVDDPRIKARPALHYRLPNCHIESPRWSLAQPWQTWCIVEKLAADSAALDELSQAFLAADRPLIGMPRTAWTEHLEQWLSDRGWA